MPITYPIARKLTVAKDKAGIITNLVYLLEESPQGGNQLITELVSYKYNRKQAHSITNLQDAENSFKKIFDEYYPAIDESDKDNLSKQMIHLATNTGLFLHRNLPTRLKNFLNGEDHAGNSLNVAIRELIASAINSLSNEHLSFLQKSGVIVPTQQKKVTENNNEIESSHVKNLQGVLHQVTDQSKQIIECFDDAQPLSKIFYSITPKIINDILKQSIELNQYPQHFTLSVNNNGYELMKKERWALQKTQLITKPSALFNVNVKNSNNNIEIIIDPHSHHYMLDTNWAATLKTTGRDKHFKFSIRICYDKSTNDFKADLAMKASKKSPGLEVGSESPKFLGISLANSNARKHLINHYSNSPEQFTLRMKEIYNSTSARTHDAKLENILYNPLDGKIVQIDTDNYGSTNVNINFAIKDLLNSQKEVYPQAYHYHISQMKKAAEIVHFYERSYKYNLSIDNNFNTQEYESKKGNYTFLDNTGQVFRLKNTANPAFEVIYIPYKLTLDNYKETNEPFYNQHSRKIWYKDSLATELLSKKSELVQAFDENILPFLFPIAPYQIKNNFSTNSSLIGLNMVLKICEESAKDENIFQTLKDELQKDLIVKLNDS